ncbi:MAG: hypothetical protein IH985_05565, partial [Planctomycetes bacterium]|nr:hypothetical protein [Planctomycetota bacterium]
MQPKQHVSAAIAHLRFHVATLCTIFALAVLVQMMVFGFVHFTDARWESAQDATDGAKTQQLSVVSATAQPAAGPSDDVEAESAEPRVQTLGRKSTTLEELEAQKNVVVLSKWHFVMNQYSDLAVTIGVVAALGLAVLTFLGVVVGGGASVPGVEKAVTACTWSLVLALLALPWSDVFSSMPYAGLFGGFERMVSGSEAVSAGAGSSFMLFAMHVLMPMAGLGIALLVATRFWAGVSRGVIVSSVSELDRAIDQEISGIRARGVSSNMG